AVPPLHLSMLSFFRWESITELQRMCARIDPDVDVPQPIFLIDDDASGRCRSLFSPQVEVSPFENTRHNDEQEERRRRRGSCKRAECLPELVGAITQTDMT